MSLLPRRAVLSAAAIFLATQPPAAAQTRTSPPANTPAARPALPQEMLGTWAREQAECIDSDSEGRLHVTLKVLEFFDSKLEFSRVAGLSGGWWRVEGMSRETGKRARRASLELRMKTGDVLVLRNGPEKPEEFVRCKPAQLQG